ncbi:MAG: hypothetical protein GXY74_11165 [Phycisphaerae bacterium]|nr:hypothetical protein [Phycisphaerae bacterium]
MTTGARIAVGAVLVLAMVGGVRGQEVIRITADDTPSLQYRIVTPRTITREKMDRSGTVDGQNWSIDLDLSETPLVKAMEHLKEIAAATPRGVTLVWDVQDMRDASLNMDWPVTAQAKGLSLSQALGLILPPEMDFEVHEDGTVLLGPKNFLPHDLTLKIYDVGEVLSVLTVPAAAAPAGGGMFAAPEPAENAQERLRCLIERTTMGGEPWESMGGRATIDFASPGLMLVSNSDEVHNRVVSLCKGLLVVHQARRAALARRLQATETAMEDLRAARRKLSDELRDVSLDGEPIGTDQGADFLLSQIRDLRHAVSRARMEMATRAADVEARTQVLAEARAEAQRRLDADTLFGATKRSLERQRNALAAMLNADPPADANEINGLRAKLDHEQSWLAMLENQLGDASRIGNMQNEINAAKVRHAQAAAQLKETEAALEAMNPRHAFERLDRVEELRRQQGVLDRRIEERQWLADSIRRQLDGVPEPPCDFSVPVMPAPAPGDAGE